MAWVRRFLGRGLAVAGLLVLGLLVLRALDVRQGPPLRPWHVVVPPELSVAALDAADWVGWMAAEALAFATVQREVVDRLAAEDRGPANRYDPTSPLHPARFANDWNRSFVLAPPSGEAVGAVVLLHGLTDAPYSLRHLAELYRDRGYLAVGLRLPGHGTVPAGLITATAETWMAAVRLAVREARARIGPGLPLHLVGYSNGGALAVTYALDSLEDAALTRPDRLILLSPMIGVTGFARFAGLAGLPALLPAFAAAAWLDILPEFNPFKYNSFPVNAARQTHRLTTALQAKVQRLAGAGRLGGLAPVLTFQSVADATVSTRAVFEGLYAHLPANGSEVVLFDINRQARIGPLVAPDAAAALDRQLPAGLQAFAMTVITNIGPETAQVQERTTAAGDIRPWTRTLDMGWPRDVFSLSHVTLPFPVGDGLYGLAPKASDDFGVSLGALAPRGERGVLVISLDSLTRITSNPFYDYLAGRVGAAIPSAP